ncbi:hypothetical protein [Mycolicibacterium elephantis]|uniref:hypothetical protein n=1 Tax=Mycolicibacterium elephantis TaxID=81858 RepID=UPI0007E93F7D|nr:hypothetical protein [Mycolicibacterium elephantis]OBB20613.1 hypothetical protein A5762_15255 [Mycolicibacterium elephantis]
MTAPINPDATLIPDKAEVWLALASDVADISAMIPALPDDDLAALGWEFTGLISDTAGISLEPTIEVVEYDAFGHPKFRVKLRKGKLNTGFTALERNAVTNKIVLPGSGPGKLGRPKNVQVYVLYRYVDEDTGEGKVVWTQLRPAPVEVSAISGIVEGELWNAEMIVHHTADASGDVFQVVVSITKEFAIGAGVTAYTATVDGQTTDSLTTLDAPELESALQGLSTVGATGVTVTGTGGAEGTLTAVFTVPVSTVDAEGTGGDVTVS